MAPKPDPTQEGASAEGTSGIEATQDTDGDQPPALSGPRSGVDAILESRKAMLEMELNEGLPEGAERITVDGDPSGAPEEDKDGQQATPPAGAGDEGDGSPPPDGGDGQAPAAPPAAASEHLVEVTLVDGSKVKVPAANISTTVKLDGEERTVNGLDLTIRRYQKEEVSAARFREAKLMKEEAQRLRQQGAPAPQQPPQPAKGDGTPAPSNEDPEDDADWIEYHELVQFGDAKEAAKKYREIMAKQGTSAPASTIDPQQIVQQAVHVLEDKQHLASDLAAVGGAYPGIFEDPDLYNHSARNVHQLRFNYLTELGIDLGANPSLADVQRHYEAQQAKGTVPNRRELFMEAAEVTAKWIDSKGGKNVRGQEAPADPPKTTHQQDNPPPANGGPRTFLQKAQGKRGMQTPPSQSSGARDQPPPATPPAQSGSDAVAEMRRARGQMT